MTTSVPTNGRTVNLSRAERAVSVAAGGLLLARALRRRDPAAIPLAMLGGALAIRGVSGRSTLYRRIGVRAFDGAEGAGNVIRGRGIRIERTITIQRPTEELFQFWRRFENLPRFMRHLKAVWQVSPGVYRWVAKAPAGTLVQWDAEILEEHAPWFLSWRSIPGTGIENAGSVRFTPAPAGRGTELRVVLAYKPPAGALGAVLARLLGEEPAIQVRGDLGRFKQIMETGELTTAAMQPGGAR
jgi:uncharacterized membrane protein